MSFKMAMRVPNLTGCGIKLLSNAYLKNCLVNGKALDLTSNFLTIKNLSNKLFEFLNIK